MRSHVLILVLVLAPWPSVSAETPAASDAPADTARIARLVAQLGSAKFKEREAAAQALATAGASALEALGQAAQNRDPEVRRRAAGLAQDIHKRLETAELLEPKRVHLVYEDTPVAGAASDFARKTGFPIQVNGADRDRHLTLDTGETTFWEAFDQFCRKAGLVERVSQSAPTQEVRVWNARAGLQGQAVMVTTAYRTTPAPGSDGRLTLTYGKPPALPTCYVGAVRIRALPTNGRSWSPGKDETLVVLEVTPQPKMAWLGAQDVRIDRAVDEHGQSLSPVLPGAPTDPVSHARRLGNGVVILDAETGRPVADARETPVRLRRGEKTSKRLTELTGAVTAHVQTPPQPLLTLDGVLRAAGKTVKGAEGEALKLLNVTRLDNGDYKLKFQLEHTQQGVGGMMNRRAFVRRNRLAVMNGNGGGRDGLLRESGSVGELHLALQDADGQRFELVDTGYNLVTTGTGIGQEITSVYRARDGQGEPARLVYTNRRTVAIEVPFTLKDVPLP